MRFCIKESRKRKSGKIVAKIGDYRAVWKLVVEIISVGVEASGRAGGAETVEAVCMAFRAGGQTVAFPGPGEGTASAARPPRLPARGQGC